MRHLFEWLKPLALCLALFALAGCTCPENARTVFDYGVDARVSELTFFGRAQVELSVNEQVALIKATDSDVSFSELLASGEGDMLSGGGTLLAKFEGDFVEEVDLSGEGSYSVERLVIVRLDPTDDFLRIEGSVYWDQPDCDVVTSFDVVHQEESPDCGDGMVEGPETCDDENRDDEDGCASCEITPGQCLGTEPERWNYWSCEGEPSECELRECRRDSEDPNCDLSFSVELSTATTGLARAGQILGAVTSGELPDLRCSCTETALFFACNESCSIEAMPCTTLEAEGSADYTFQQWYDGCEGDEPCVVNSTTSSVLGVFSSVDDGLSGETELLAYPSESAELSVTAVGDGGGFIVVSADLLGELDNPAASDPSEDEAAHPVIVAFTPDLSVAWSRDIFVTDGVLQIRDIGVDADGNVYVVAGLIGTLDLEGGTLTVQYIDPSVDHPLELVILKFSPLGVHLWTRTLGLLTRTDLLAASIDVDATGTMSLAAVVDENYVMAGTAIDLITATLSPDGDVNWRQELQLDEDAGQVAIAPHVASIIDDEGSVFVAARVTGEGPFQYEVPAPPEAGGPSTFLAKFSSIGEHLWSEELTIADMESIEADVNASDQVVVLTRSDVIFVDADGNQWYSREHTRRPSGDETTAPPDQHLALDPVGGDFVALTRAIVPLSSGGTDAFTTTMASRFDESGAHQWTVELADVPDESEHTPRGAAIANDQVFVVSEVWHEATSLRGIAVRRLGADE